MNANRNLRALVVTMVIVVFLIVSGSPLAAQDFKSPESNKEIAHRWFGDLMNHHNFPVIDTIIAPDFVGHMLAGSQDIHGQAGVRDLVFDLHAMLSDLHVTELALVADGDMVNCLTVTRGTFSQEWGGLLPNGANIQYVGNTLFRFQDDQIVEAWFVYDTLGLMEQLTAPPIDPTLYP